MAFIAALDIGGTNARLALRVDGQSPCFFRGAGFTLLQSGEEGVLSHCRALIVPALAEHGLSPADCTALCCGAAGVDAPEAYAVYTNVFIRLGFPPSAIHIYNDCELPLAALSVPAVLVASGTGSIVLARTADGRITRCGGWGFFTSDEASACRIVLDALSLASRAWDDLESAPLLTSLLRDEAGIATPLEAEIFARNALTEKRLLAALAPLVCRAAQQGDEATARLLDENARRLAANAVVAARKAGLIRPPVLLWGSLLTETDALRIPLSRHLRQHLSGDIRLVEISALESALALAEQLQKEASQ